MSTILNVSLKGELVKYHRFSQIKCLFIHISIQTCHITHMLTYIQTILFSANILLGWFKSNCGFCNYC